MYQAVLLCDVDLDLPVVTMVVPIVVYSEGVVSGARILCHIWQYRV